MKLKKSALVSTAMIDRSRKAQCVKRHLALYGNPPYVTSAKTVRIERIPAEQTAGGGLRHVLDDYLCVESNRLRKRASNNNSI